MEPSVRHFGYSRSSGLAPSRVIWMTSPFSDSIVFTVHTKKRRFKIASFSNRSTREERFRMTPFPLIVFGVVVWTIVLSEAKKLRFCLKTD